MNTRAAAVLAAVCALPIPLATPRNSAAAKLEAFASVEAGTAGVCTVAPVFLPDGFPQSGVYGVPINGNFQACGFSLDSGLADDLQSTGSADASWTASSAKFSGASQAHAGFGTLGASASGTNSAQGTSLGNAAGAFGAFTDTLTVTSPSQANGAGGYAVFDFAVDGQVAAHNGAYDPGVTQQLGHADARVLVRVDTTAANVFLAQVYVNGSQAPSTNPLDATGFTATQEPTGWTFTGSTAAYSPQLEIQFGTPFVFTAGLLAEAYPQTESSATGDAGVDFLTSARLTGIQVFNAGASPVAVFQVNAESGTQYAPEAGAAAAPGAALAALLGLRARRHGSQ